MRFWLTRLLSYGLLPVVDMSIPFHSLSLHLYPTSTHIGMFGKSAALHYTALSYTINYCRLLVS